jgi:hypothetical protein
MPAGLVDEFLEEVTAPGSGLLQEMNLTAGDPHVGEMKGSVHALQISHVPSIHVRFEGAQSGLLRSRCGYDVVGVLVDVIVYFRHKPVLPESFRIRYSTSVRVLEYCLTVPSKINKLSPSVNGLIGCLRESIQKEVLPKA